MTHEMTHDSMEAASKVVSRPSILWIQGLTPDMPYMLVCPYVAYGTTEGAYAPLGIHNTTLYTTVHMYGTRDHPSRVPTHEVSRTAHFMTFMT